MVQTNVQMEIRLQTNFHSNFVFEHMNNTFLVSAQLWIRICKRSEKRTCDWQCSRGMRWEMSFMLAVESLHLSSIYAIWLDLVDIENKNQQINVHMWASAQWHDERRRRVARKFHVCDTNTGTMPSRHRQHMCANIIKSRSIFFFPFTAFNIWIVCLVIIRIGFPWAFTHLQLAPAQL